MNKVNLTTLRDAIYDDLAIIPVPMLERLFAIGKTRTPEEVFLSRVKASLLDFERYYPVKLTLKCPAVQCLTSEISGTWVETYYQEGGAKYITFYDNVEQVFYNLLPERDLSMIPLAVKRLQMNYGVSHPSDYRQFEYQKPNLYGAGIGNYPYYSGLFKYPVIVDKRNTNVVKLENCWVLFLFEGDDTYRTFKKQLLVKVCDYLMDLKGNFQIAGVPIEALGSLQQIRDRADRLLQIEYSQAAVSWGWD
jgi:hypothetical protein